MPLAVIDFAAERWKLFNLLIAILQPLLLLALCAIFVVASVHLLTMLGTRWGHRKVSSKALLFSISLHVAIGIGILALLPESRTRIWATLARENRDETVVVRTSDWGAEESHGTGGSLSSLRELPRPENITFTRTDRLSDPFTEPAPEVARPETEPIIPDASAPSYTVPPVEVTPERVAATQQVLEEFAAATLPEPAVPDVAPQPEATVGTPDFSRSIVPNPNPAPNEESVETQRPASGSVDRVDDVAISLPEPKSLGVEVDESAELVRGDDPEVALRTGVVAAPATADPQTGADVPESTASAPSSEGTRIARTGPLRANDVGDAMESPPQVERPRQSSAPSGEASAVDVPFTGPSSTTIVEQPSLARVESSGPPSQLPATYQMRAPELQQSAVEQHGGSRESQAAVELGLRFLAASQEKEGYWSVRRWEGGYLSKAPDGQARDFRAADLDVGVTALATLAFLGKGNSLTEGEYSDNVQRGVKWLCSQQHSSGFIGIEARDARTNTVPGNMAGMYGHGMATFAIAEAFAMSPGSEEASILKRRIELAVAFILAAQLEDGGWRYFQYQTQGGDMSLFGWQLMALKSAQLGGVSIPARVREKMISFLKENQRGEKGGLAAYRKMEPVSAPMTAEALFCRQILGVQRDAESSREAVNYLLSPQRIPSRQRMDLYYWYYGMLAMCQYGDPEWNQWNVRVRDLLVSEQVTEGGLAGSWAPRDPWSGYGGRIYSTAMATLCLEVYFRYLPLYQQVSPRLSPAEPREP